eukprot:scaffold11068_cov72-Skeletonema_dohrnii-CCMP3373.AAC.1
MIRASLLLSIIYANVITTSALVSPIGLKRQGERKHASLFSRRGSDIESDSLLSILSEDETGISSQQKKIIVGRKIQDNDRTVSWADV